jgi:hypothetical protein
MNSSATKRVLLSFLAALVAGAMSYVWLSATGISDVYPRLCIARLLVSGAEPYSSCMTLSRGLPAADYPMTTILALVPLSFLNDRLGASMFWATSNGLLMYGILRRGELRYLLIFTTGSYWATFIWQQFSVLITAVFLLPSLLPIALVKPQIGIPVVLTNLSRNRVIACVIFVLVTFLVYPGWLLFWYGRSHYYDGAIPLLTLPLGPLLLLLLLKWRNRDALYLLLMGCMPQRTLMDVVSLFLLPKTTLSLIIACLLSWIPATLFILNPAAIIPKDVMPLTLIFIYLPILTMQFFPELRGSIRVPKFQRKL